FEIPDLIHEAFFFILGEFYAVHHFHPPGSRDILDPVVGDEAQAQLVVIGRFGRDKDYAVGSPGSVNGRRSSIFQYGDTFYVGRVEVPAGRSTHCKSIDNEQRGAPGPQRADSPDLYV